MVTLNERGYLVKGIMQITITVWERFSSRLQISGHTSFQPVLTDMCAIYRKKHYGS